MNTQSFMWQDIEQWVNLKWNAVTMKQGFENHHICPSLRKKCFLESNYSYTNPAYAENKWKLVLNDFSWNSRSVI